MALCLRNRPKCTAADHILSCSSRYSAPADVHLSPTTLSSTMAERKPFQLLHLFHRHGDSARERWKSQKDGNEQDGQPSALTQLAPRYLATKLIVPPFGY